MKPEIINDICLTKHFMLSEFTRSETAMRNGIDNSLDITTEEDLKVMENLQHICKTILEPLRRHSGKPIIVSSGYRSPELNRQVGGVRNSQHQTGEAVDIVAQSTDGKTLREWFLFIQSRCRFDQLIMESNGSTRWIHVSCCRDDSKNRQRVLQLKKQ